MDVNLYCKRGTNYGDKRDSRRGIQRRKIQRVSVGIIRISSEIWDRNSRVRLLRKPNRIRAERQSKPATRLWVC